jgi:RHS repeat-associated protein
MERDESTGLEYHSARYFAPWLARWTAADPAGIADGTNQYVYVRGNPLIRLDWSGRASVEVDNSATVLGHLLYGSAAVDANRDSVVDNTQAPLGALARAVVSSHQSGSDAHQIASDVHAMVISLEQWKAADQIYLDQPIVSASGATRMRSWYSELHGLSSEIAQDLIGGLSQLATFKLTGDEDLAKTAGSLGVGFGGALFAAASAVPASGLRSAAPVDEPPLGPGAMKVRGEWSHSVEGPFSTSTSEGPPSIVLNPTDLVPPNATKRGLRPDPNGGAQEGVEFKWMNAEGQTVRLRAHGVDGNAPPGSNAASGPVYRVQVGGRFLDYGGTRFPRGIQNPDSPNFNEAAVNATHIPWPPEVPLPYIDAADPNYILWPPDTPFLW